MPSASGSGGGGGEGEGGKGVAWGELGTQDKTQSGSLLSVSWLHVVLVWGPRGARALQCGMTDYAVVQYIMHIEFHSYIPAIYDAAML